MRGWREAAGSGVGGGGERPIEMEQGVRRMEDAEQPKQLDATQLQQRAENSP